jgi:hypothetical protein
MFQRNIAPQSSSTTSNIKEIYSFLILVSYPTYKYTHYHNPRKTQSEKYYIIVRTLISKARVDFVGMPVYGKKDTFHLEVSSSVFTDSHLDVRYSNIRGSSNKRYIFVILVIKHHAINDFRKSARQTLGSSCSFSHICLSERGIRTYKTEG